MTKIFVAGHNGMVGSAIVRVLEPTDCQIITACRETLDLTNQVEVKRFFDFHKFDQVYLAAAKVGGIHANNTYPANFVYDNLMIQSNVIHSAYESSVKKLLFLGSSCIYPKFARQPIDESELSNGKLEPTNEPYAIAKIAGIKMCESYARQYGADYRSIMPTNLYGPGDNYHPDNSHVVPGLIHKLHLAKSSDAEKVTAWGTGSALREFLHVDDLAAASVFTMNIERETYAPYSSMESHINVGSGVECSIRDLASMIANIVGYRGEIVWDKTKPDGAPRKLLNTAKINSLGWHSSIGLREGLADAYRCYVDTLSENR